MNFGKAEAALRRLAIWIANASLLAHAEDTLDTSPLPPRAPRRAALQRGRPAAERARLAHLPFFDGAAEVWRCSWCGAARSLRRLLLATECVGLPPQVRLVARQQALELAAPEPIAEAPAPHWLWRRGPWLWCARCDGVSSRRLKLLGRPCDGRLATPGRAQRVHRLRTGWTPHPPLTRIDAPAERFDSPEVADVLRAWEQGVASILDLDPRPHLTLEAPLPLGEWRARGLGDLERGLACARRALRALA